MSARNLRSASCGAMSSSDLVDEGSRHRLEPELPSGAPARRRWRALPQRGGPAAIQIAIGHFGHGMIGEARPRFRHPMLANGAMGSGCGGFGVVVEHRKILSSMSRSGGALAYMTCAIWAARLSAVAWPRGENGLVHAPGAGMRQHVIAHHLRQRVHGDGGVIGAGSARGGVRGRDRLPAPRRPRGARSPAARRGTHRSPQ